MPWHNLRPNKSTSSGTAHVFLDCETTRSDASYGEFAWLETLRLGSATSVRIEGGQATRRDTLDFVSADEWWNWFERKLAFGRATWLWCHNAPFDLQVVRFPERCEAGHYSFRWQARTRRKSADNPLSLAEVCGQITLDDPPTILVCRHVAGGLVRAVDTLNWFRVPLARLGDWVELPKLPMPDREAPDAEWQEYCRRDVEILEAAVLRIIDFVRENDLGMLRSTAPSQAFAAFRHRGMRHKIVFHDETYVKALEREGYYGGQVAAYYLGEVETPAGGSQALLADRKFRGERKPEGPIYALDSNSAFPSVMRDRLYPRKLVAWGLIPQGEAATNAVLGVNCVARVLLRSAIDSYPVRPEGQTVYCTGRFWTTLAGPELAYAWESGHVEAVGSWAAYDLAPLFAEWIDDMYSLRQSYSESGHVMEANLCKLLMNSLYGKFGQRSPEWNDLPGEIGPQAWGGWVEYNRETETRRIKRAFAHAVQELAGRGEGKNSFPAISAWVTSYQRQEMRRLRSIAGSDHVLYQGVDSLYVTPRGYALLQRAGEIDPKRLGALRLQGTADRMRIMAHHCYSFGDRLTIAGRPQDKQLIDGREWTHERFHGLARVVASGPAGGVGVTVHQMLLPTTYNRGRVDKFGWVWPHELNPQEG